MSINLSNKTQIVDQLHLPKLEPKDVTIQQIARVGNYIHYIITIGSLIGAKQRKYRKKGKIATITFYAKYNKLF